MTENKWFEGRKYCLNQGRWIRITRSCTSLAHDVWSSNYPEDPVKKGEVIHHIDEKPLNDSIENLQKMATGSHNSLHQAEESLTQNKYRKKYVWQKSLFSIYDKEDCFLYRDYLRYNRKTGRLGFHHTWGNYRQPKNCK